MKRTKKGRPSKFNQDRVESILEAAREGTSKAGCARAGGISYDTLRRWLEKSKAGEDFSDFYQRFTRARAEGERELVKKCREKDPKFILATSYGYQRTERRELDIEQSGGGSSEVSEEDAKELEDYVESFRDRFGAG